MFDHVRKRTKRGDDDDDDEADDDIAENGLFTSYFKRFAAQCLHTKAKTKESAKLAVRPKTFRIELHGYK